MIRFNQNNISNIKGFGLIEIIIAATILSLGLLGVAVMQSRSINITKDFSAKETAVRAINQLGVFLLSMNKSEISKLFDNTSGSCLNTYCSRTILFNSIITEWKSTLSQLLPNGQGCLCVVSSTNNTSVAGAVKIRLAVKWTSLSGINKIESLDNEFLSNSMPISAQYNCPNIDPNTDNRCNFL